MNTTSIRSVLAGWHFSFYECWTDWMPWNIGRMNWRNFTLAHIDAEWSTSFPRSLEFTCVLLGVGFTLNWFQPEDVSELEEIRTLHLREQPHE